MKNIYHNHLNQLRNITKNSCPAVSIYVPLNLTESIPGKIFSSLLRVADNLLLKSGFQKIEIITPDWDRWIKQGIVTPAIFYHNRKTILIPLMTSLQPRVIVARSFHIKPIVTAANENIDTLLIHFNQAGASLYRINPVSESLINHYYPSSSKPVRLWPKSCERETLGEFLDFLRQEVKGSKLSTTKYLGITGSLFKELQQEDFWKKTSLPLVFFNDSFRSLIPHNSFSLMRDKLAQSINEKHTVSVLNVLMNKKETNETLTLKNLVPKILKNEIKKLCVSLETMQFGEVDLKTGNILINRSQSDANDYDVLDDLVELAIDRGIEVSVVPNKYLPVNRNFLAS